MRAHRPLLPLLAALVALTGLVAAAPAVAGTSLSTGGCSTPAALSFPALLGAGSAVTSADCTISFGSSDSTAQLRVRQADRAGTALWRVTGGDADTSFDGDGLRTQNPTVDNDVPRRAIALPDGGTLLVGAQGSPATPFALQLSAAGLPVPAFGASGVATWDVPGGAPDYAFDVARQADGKLVVVGSSGTDVAISRLLADGTPDPTFSSDGHVRIDLGGIADQATGVAIRPGGRIVVAGTGTTTGGFALQLLADGSRDRDAFAAPTGLATSAIGTQFTVNDLALLHDGRVVVVGATSATSDTYTARFGVSGALDAGFGALDHGASAAAAAAAVAQPDGMVLVASSDANRGYVSRYTRTGALDTTFGTSGVATIDPTAGTESIAGIDLDAVGNVYATVRVHNGGSLIDAGVVRLRPAGALDQTFDGDGWKPWTINATDPDQFNDVAVSASGSVTLVGTRRLGAGPDWELVAARMATTTVNDYGAGGTWASGSMFGACLRTVSGTGASATWTTSATCPTTDGAYWNAVPSGTTGGEVASTSTAGVVDASAALRFGVRSDGTLTGGAYVAPVTVEVLSPNLDAPVNTVVPTIGGTPTVRKLLTAATGTWTGSATIHHTYQWRRCDVAGANCVDIVGATSSTYLLAAADAGATIRVAVTGTNTEGSATGTSVQTATIAAAPASGVTYLTGFEHRTASDLGGGISVGINKTGTATATPETSIVHSGTSAMRFAATGDMYQWDVDLPLATQHSATARAYLNLQSYPTANTSFMQLEGTTGTQLFCEMVINPGGTITGMIYKGTPAAFSSVTGPVLELNRWYLVEFTCDASVALHRLDWRVDGQPQPAVTAAGGAADWIEGFQIGIDLADTWDIVLDDVSVSRNIADYPLGPARTLAYRPNGIGAISSPATWFWSTNDAASMTAFGAGDANLSPGRSTLVDEWPVTTGGAADFIEQSSDNATLDLQVENTAETTAPTAVSVVGAQREFVTGANNSTVSAQSTGSTPLWSRNPVSGAGSLEYYAATMPSKPAGGAWTTAAFDALEVRLSGSDATPDIWTDAMLVEAEFPVGEFAQNVGLPTILGAPKGGSTLLATPGTWSPSPSGYAYRWRRCNAAGAACVDIAGATSATYVAVALDSGNTLRVVVTATTPAGNQSATSAATTIVAPGAPTLTYLTGFEHGTASASGTALFDTVVNATVSSDIPRNGRYALHATSDGVTESYALKNLSGPSRVVQRYAIMLDELPTGVVELSEIDVNTGGNCEIAYDGAGHLAADLGSTLVPSSMAIEPNRWYVIDIRCDTTAATRVMDWRIDGVPQTQVTRGGQSIDVTNRSHVGIEGTGVGAPTSVRYDDWAISTTNADYPLGPGKVIGLKPDATATHTSPGSFGYSIDGANNFTAMSGADDNLLPGSAAYLDDWPIEFVGNVSGELVRQNALAGHLDYQLSDGEESGAVNAVRFVGAHHSATPGVPQGVDVRARLGASTSTAYSLEIPAGSLSYLGGLLTTRPGGGAWTGPDLDALRLELDSSDVGTATNERPRTYALIAEADLPVGAMATKVMPPGVSVPYDVPKVGDEVHADDGTWSGVPVVGHRYAWLRCTAAGTGCTVISGESGPAYTLQPGDAGSRIRVVDLAVSHAGAQGARSAATELVSTQPSFAYFTGFEHGSLDAATGDVVFTANAGVSIDTTNPRSGARSMTSAGSGAATEVEWHPAVATPQAVMRFAFRIDGAPSATASVLELKTTSGSYLRGRLTAGRVLQMEFYDGSSHGNVSGPVLNANQWYLIDVTVDAGAATWRLDWRVDGAQQPSSTFAVGGGASAFSEYQWGVGNASVVTARYDDVAISMTPTDFPIGNGRIEALSVDGQAGGGTPGQFSPGIGGWAALLDDLPLTSSADYIQQDTIVSSATDHVPFTFANPASTNAARAVRAYATYGATAAGTNHVGVRVRRPGDTLAASPSVFSGNAELAALTTKAAIIPVPPGGWTQAALAATDLLVGFSTDVAPAPRVHGALLEVEYRG